MTTNVTIIKGDTGPMWKITVPQLDADGDSNGNATLTNYTCWLKGAGINREITQKNSSNNAFLVQLTSSDTRGLAIGQHRLAVEVTDNASPEYTSEVHFNVTIKRQRV
jgi:hypothetical protein